jgi:hypothetical protein
MADATNRRAAESVMGILIMHLLIVIIAKPYSALVDTLFWTVGYILQIVAIILVISAQSSIDTDKIASLRPGRRRPLRLRRPVPHLRPHLAVLRRLRDPAALRGPARPVAPPQRPLNSNVSQFAEELRHMELNGG